MLEKNCPYCDKNKGLQITYNNELDGTGLHILCIDCIDVFFKNQPPSIILYNSNDKY
ncbi:MAG: hypothetical protein MUO82_01620 [Candidatus Thermoplasmatota archaeon]|nr:hypothetical protein [Candidatus Thermoplasmatota archaeon]